MKRLVSGVTATGKLTIGNYLGAIRNVVDLQDDYEIFIFVADLHALTSEIAPDELSKNRRDIYALYLACGIDPMRSTIFFQSDVSEHGTMSWIMENQTTIGELSRMTQFKDKAKVKEANGTEKIRTGLLTYPTLMAGDILLYQPNVVPAGIDQKQHIELTRNIAERFNNKYGQTFLIPDHFTAPLGGKILSLQEPTKKMSKSDKNLKSSIFLLDDPEEAYIKIQKAVTDSENKVYADPINKPGVTNLLTIYALIRNHSMAHVENHFRDADYGSFKQEVGEAVKGFLIGIQKSYEQALPTINEVAAEGAKRASNIAKATLNAVKGKLGL